MKDANSGRAAAWIRRHWKHLIVGHAFTVALVLGILFGAGVFASQSSWLTAHVRGAHGGKVTLTVPKAAVKQAATSNLGGHENARDETPPGATAKVIRAAKKQQAAFARVDRLPHTFPLAAPEQRGCRTELVQDYSSRNGVKPRGETVHYTVSSNIPHSWADVNSVVHEFNTWAFQASSNYVIDGEGNCAYIVREVDKAWTQAAYNPDMISIEVINTGHESVYAAPAGLAKIGLVLSDSMCRWKIPLQVGAVSGGRLTRPGLFDHSMLGTAGGGHHDITPYSVGQVLAAVKQARAKHGCPGAPKPKPVTKPKLVAPAVLRAKTGEWSWIAWRFAQAAWRGYPRADPAVRSHVSKTIPAAWWRDAAKHGGAK